MDIGKIISRAWKITWRWKALWLLGLLVVLGGGSNSSSGGDGVAQLLNYRFSQAGTPGWVSDMDRWVNAPGIIALLLSLMGLAVLFGLALWVVSIIADGGLIAGVQQAEDEGSTSFRRGWRVGVARFWTLLGIDLLFGLAVFVLVGLLIGFILIVTLAGGGAIRSGGLRSVLPAIFLPLICCGVPLCCGVFLLGIALGVIRIYAHRAAVLENHNALDAIGRGWRVLRQNPGNTLLLLLIFIGIAIGIGMVLGGSGMAIAGPFVFSFPDRMPGPGEIAGLVLLGGLLGLVGLFLNTILTTFTSAIWTLAYREFTMPQPAPAVAAPAAAEPIPAPPAPDETPPGA